MSIQEQVEKKYDPRDTTLKFVDRRDDLDPVCKIHFFSCWTWSYAVVLTWITTDYWFLTSQQLIHLLLCTSVSEDGDGCLRAEMSCGHAVTPESLTLWCRSQLDEVPHVLCWRRESYNSRTVLTAVTQKSCAAATVVFCDPKLVLLFVVLRGFIHSDALQWLKVPHCVINSGCTRKCADWLICLWRKWSTLRRPWPAWLLLNTVRFSQWVLQCWTLTFQKIKSSTLLIFICCGCSYLSSLFSTSVPTVQNKCGEEGSLQPVRPVHHMYSWSEEDLSVLLAVSEAVEGSRPSIGPLRQRRLRQQGPAASADM